MTKKKIAIIFGAILVVLVGVFVLIKREGNQLPPPFTQTGLRTPFPTTKPSSFDIEKVKNQETINVSGVTVNNYYKGAIVTAPDGYALFEVNENYKFSYIPVDNSFLISIIENPFDKVRIEAETAFLKKLNITQKEACRLNVSVSTNIRIDPGRAGVNYPISFCE